MVLHVPVFHVHKKRAICRAGIVDGFEMSKKCYICGLESRRRHAKIEYLISHGKASRWLPLRSIGETIRHLEEHS
jgi:hypothetical protein